MANPPHLLHSRLSYSIWEPGLLLHGSGSRSGSGPPSTSIHHAFLPGPDERIRGLDLVDMEGEGAPSSLVVPPPGTPLNVNSISESMGGLCLHANEAWASGGLQLHGSDLLSLERQLDTILGP
jgi:hypothetical protein